MGFILAREFLYVSLDFSLGFLAGFWEGIVGPVSDAFWIELNHWTAPFLSIVSVVGGAGTGLWIIFKQSKGQSPFQWLFKSIWEPNHGSFFTWPFFIGLSLSLGWGLCFFYWFSPDHTLPRPFTSQMLNAPFIPQLFWIVLIVVIAPFIEECLFRGILYAGFSQTWGPLPGGIIVTGMFVAVHFPKIYVYPPAALAILCLGLATLWLRMRTQALTSGMVCHMTYNAFCVMGMFLF
ncbi:CPBP family intramembrane glutamic endopeptidase [uncultured Nitrospira sp.]|uniref:CPBP family intramembrane glutamic endopeptidase n=1 Tax=uncultured Nitrospira sp. TaxID=157176 RepID=UPI003140C07C